MRQVALVQVAPVFTRRWNFSGTLAMIASLQVWDEGRWVVDSSSSSPSSSSSGAMCNRCEHHHLTMTKPKPSPIFLADAVTAVPPSVSPGGSRASSSRSQHKSPPTARTNTEVCTAPRPHRLCEDFMPLG